VESVEVAVHEKMSMPPGRKNNCVLVLDKTPVQMMEPQKSGEEKKRKRLSFGNGGGEPNINMNSSSGAGRMITPTIRGGSGINKGSRRHRARGVPSRLPIACPYCNKVLSRKDSLKPHIIKLHPGMSASKLTSQAGTGKLVLRDSQTMKTKHKINRVKTRENIDIGIKVSSFEQEVIEVSPFEQEVIEVIDISQEDSPPAFDSSATKQEFPPTLLSTPIQLPPGFKLLPNISISRSIQLPPGIKLPSSISISRVITVSVDNSGYKKRKRSTPEYLFK